MTKRETKSVNRSDSLPGREWKWNKNVYIEKI